MAGQEKLEKVKAKYDKGTFEKVYAEVAKKVRQDPNMAAQPPISFESFSDVWAKVARPSPQALLVGT